MLLGEGIPVQSDLRMWLECADFSRIVTSASKSSRTLSALITLTYSDDALVCWRSIDAIGRCAERLSAQRPQMFRNYLQRLFWMMSDESGSVAPRAPEIIGEIICSNPGTFQEYISLTMSLMALEPEDLPRFLPGVLYALARIGPVAPDGIDDAAEGIEQAVTSPDPQARAMSVWCLGCNGWNSILLRHPGLETDSDKVRIYRDEKVLSTTVAKLYAEALAGTRDPTG